MSSDVTADQRRRMIAEAAYFLAQRRGFANGDATRDWLLAEALKIKLHEQGESGSAPLRANGAHSHIAWEALSAALHSIIPEKK